MQASPYQTQIFSFIRANEERARNGQKRRHLIVTALAGSGKTTTVRECIRIAHDEYGRSVAYAMFTRDTVDEFKEKNADARWLRNVNTAHGFGLAALRRKVGTCKLNKDKLRNLFSDLFYPEDIEKKQEEMIDMLQPYVLRLTSMAKDAGIGLVPDLSSVGSGLPEKQNVIDSPYPYHAIISHHDLLSDLPKGVNQDAASNIVVEMSQRLLIESNAITDEIDYPDMIYLALLKGAMFEQFDYVFIDEAQDTNYTRRLLYKKLVKPWGCLVVVGDRHQAIFGFSGADVRSLSVFKEELDAEELPLSICYRCSLAVIRQAQRIVPKLEAAPDAPEGVLRTVRYKDFLRDVRPLQLGPESVILCRFNAPNTALAFALIRAGIPCRIEGRDIGYGLLKLMERLCEGSLSPDPVSLTYLQTNLITYRDREMKKHTDAGREGKAQNVADRCDTLLTVIDRARELRQGTLGMKSIIAGMFQDSNSDTARKDILTLSSVHKSKGREWERVFILGREDFMPSPWAKLDWEIEQEKNIIYVAETRAKDTLIFINEIPK